MKRILALDYAVARGTIKRQGLGKMRGLEVKTFWLQELAKRGLMTIKACKGSEKFADLGAKTNAGAKFKELLMRCAICRQGEWPQVHPEQLCHRDQVDAQIAKLSKSTSTQSQIQHKVLAFSL